MRSFGILSVVAAIASVGSVAAQEASRFGDIDVSPVTVKLGQNFTVHYNSTKARWQPKFLDFYLGGTLPSGFGLPDFSLARLEYGASQTDEFFTTQLPNMDPSEDTQGYNPNATYRIKAFITFPIDNETGSALEYAGVGTIINVDLS